MLLAITLGSTPTAVLAGGEALDCTEEWYLCIAESAFDEDGEYRGDWSPGTVVETIECGLDYVRCRIRKLVFW